MPEEQNPQTQENLRKLLEQHWEHCRHLEGERAQFTQVYGAIIAGIFIGYSYLLSACTQIPDYVVPLILVFLFALTLAGLFLTLRWAYSFECHRKRINEIASILWLSCNVAVPLDPTMEIPLLHIMTPKVDRIFRTRKLFPLFFLVVLCALAVISALTKCPEHLKDWKLAHCGILGVSIFISLVLIFITHRGFSSIEKLNIEKRVILAGCNGEWAQESYLPFLLNKAVNGDITLWATDIQSEIKLKFPGSHSLWQTAEGKGKACYLDMTKSKESYKIPSNVDYVFIVTPDRCHCEVAEFWLSRLSIKGKIFIEKPLDVSIDKAKDIARKMGKADTIYGFDHYLAGLHPLLPCLHSYLREIDGPKSLEIKILEKPEIPSEKADTLREGVIFDLFPHVLAVSAAIVEKKLAPTEAILQNAEFKKGARVPYEGWLFSSETFACIKFLIGNKKVTVTGRVGKGVGQKPEKEMVICDAGEREFGIDLQPYLESKPVESFLEAVLKGSNIDSAPGVMSFSAAFKILKWLWDTRGKINLGPDYDVGVDLRLLCESFLKASGTAQETRAGD